MDGGPIARWMIMNRPSTMSCTPERRITAYQPNIRSNAGA